MIDEDPDRRYNLKRSHFFYFSPKRELSRISTPFGGKSSSPIALVRHMISCCHPMTGFNPSESALEPWGANFEVISSCSSPSCGRKVHSWRKNVLGLSSSFGSNPGHHRALTRHIHHCASVQTRVLMQSVAIYSISSCYSFCCTVDILWTGVRRCLIAWERSGPFWECTVSPVYISVASISIEIRDCNLAESQLIWRDLKILSAVWPYARSRSREVTRIAPS